MTGRSFTVGSRGLPPRRNPGHPGVWRTSQRALRPWRAAAVLLGGVSDVAHRKVSHPWLSTYLWHLRRGAPAGDASHAWRSSSPASEPSLVVQHARDGLSTTGAGACGRACPFFLSRSSGPYNLQWDIVARTAANEDSAPSPGTTCALEPVKGSRRASRSGGTKSACCDGLGRVWPHEWEERQYGP